MGGRRDAVVLRRRDGGLPRRLPRSPPRALRRDDAAGGRGDDGVLRRLSPGLPDRVVQPRDGGVARAVDEGHGQVPPPLPVPDRGRGVDRAAGACASTGSRWRRSSAGSQRTAPTASPSSPWRRRRAATSTRRGCSRSRAAPARSTSSARSKGSFVYRVNALTGDPNHLGIEVAAAIVLLLPALPAPRARPSAASADRPAPRLPHGRRPRHPLAERPARARLRVPRARGAVPPPAAPADVPRPARAAPRRPLRRRRPTSGVLRGGAQLTPLDGGPRRRHALRRLLVHPRRPLAEPPLRPRPQHVLGLLRVPDGEDELRAALLLRRVVRRVRPRRDARLRRVPRLPLPPGGAHAPHGTRARGRRRSARGAHPPAGLGPGGGARLARWSRTSST